MNQLILKMGEGLNDYADSEVYDALLECIGDANESLREVAELATIQEEDQNRIDELNHQIDLNSLIYDNLSLVYQFLCDECRKEFQTLERSGENTQLCEKCKASKL